MTWDWTYTGEFLPDLLAALTLSPGATVTWQTLLSAAGQTAVYVLPGYLAGLALGAGLAVLLSLAIGVPVGVWAGLSARTRRAITPVLDVMQIMPTFAYLAPLALFFHIGAPAGAIATMIYAIPPAIRITALAISSVSPTAVEASASLGATRWQTVSRQVLPVAFPGILTGLILAVSRAIGEAAPLIMVGAVTFVTFNPRFFEGGYTTLPVQIFNYAKRPQVEFQELAAAGVLVMMGLVLVMNSVAIWLRNRYERRF